MPINLKSNIFGILKSLNGDCDHYDLRIAAWAVAECFDRHPHPEIERLKPFIEWLADYLEGIPFATEWSPNHGDYDPTRPAFWLDGMYLIFNRYHREGESIDRFRENNKDFRSIPKGEEGVSQYITSHELYELYTDGWYLKKAAEIEAELENPALTPSAALRILAENWKWYATPKIRLYMNRCIEFCILCADEFPDSDEARFEFQDIVFSVLYGQG